MQRDLLIVLNIFGTWDNILSQTQVYKDTLNSIFWHINKNPSFNIRYNL